MRRNSYSRKRISAGKFMGISTALNENLLNTNYSPVSYNFTFDKGALRSEMGIEEASTSTLTSGTLRHPLPALPDDKKPSSLHLFRKYDSVNGKRADKLLVRTTDNDFYETAIFETDTFHQVVNLAAYGKDCSACYRYEGKDLFLLSSERGFFYTYDGESVTKIDEAPNMTSMCVHAERIFATVSGEQNKVWFSKEFNPVNWKVSGTDAGFIEFDDDGGKVIKVVRFLNYVFVFRDFGIERLSAYGAQTDFSVSKIYASSSRIYPDTIVSTGDRIIFLTDEGLKYLDGYNVGNMCENLTDFLPADKRNCVGAGLNDKYYLAAYLNFGNYNSDRFLDESLVCKNNAIAACDVRGGGFSIMRGADVSSMLSLKVHTEASLLMTFTGENSGKIGRLVKSGKYFDSVLPKFWTTGYSDLGYPDREKSLREISLVSTCDVTVGVVLDGKTYEYAVSGNSLPQKIVVNRPFRRLRLFVRSEAFSITAITAPSVVVDIM